MTRSNGCALALAAMATLSISGAALAGAVSAEVSAEVKMMDGNGDGKISAEEHAAGARAMFDRMDTDRDGIVTATEMDKANASKGKQPGDMSSAEKIKVVDSNGDGKLSAEEHAAGSQKMFDKMDTDHDSFVTAAEMQAGHDAMMSKHK